MAKGNIAMGTLRGKVGDLVFTRLHGKQIAKSRNRQPMNRRTTIQQTHRAKIASCIRFFAMAQQNLFKFAFEDQRKNETDMNVFIRHNYDKVVPLTRYALSQNCPVVAPFEVTNGSLTSVRFFYSYSPEGPGGEFTENEYPQLVFSTNVAQYFNDLTIGDVSKALIRDHGCQDGDILTFVIITLWGNVDAYSKLAEEWAMKKRSLIANFTVPQWKMYQFRVNTSSSTLLRQKPGIFNPDRSADNVGDAVKPWCIELGRREGTYGNESELQQGVERQKIIQCCLIRSRFEGGKTYVSTEALYGNEQGMIFKHWDFLKDAWPKFCGESWEDPNVSDISPANILQGSESYVETKGKVAIDLYRDEACQYRPENGKSYQFLYLKVSGMLTVISDASFYPVGKSSGDTLKVTVASQGALRRYVTFAYNNKWISDDVIYQTVQPGVYRLAYEENPEQAHVFNGFFYSFMVPETF